MDNLQHGQLAENTKIYGLASSLDNLQDGQLALSHVQRTLWSLDKIRPIYIIILDPDDRAYVTAHLG